MVTCIQCGDKPAKQYLRWWCSAQCKHRHTLEMTLWMKAPPTDEQAHRCVLCGNWTMGASDVCNLHPKTEAVRLVRL